MPNSDAATAARVQAFTLFSSLQSICAAQAEAAGDAWLAAGPSVQTMQYYHRIGTLYCETIQAYISSLESLDKGESEYEQHVQELYMIFHLAQVLYFPEDGSGLGVVGEELLHWINEHDVAPTTEQGQQIAQTLPPHEHPDYWDYVFRCVLRGFYGTAAVVLQSYGGDERSETLRAVASEIVQLLQTVPRSTSFSTESAFLGAHRHWHASVRVCLTGIQAQMDDVEAELKVAGSVAASEERLELETQLRCLLELLAGVDERVLEFAEDWKEAVAAWGALVQPSLKRDDIPLVVERILERRPVDGTLPVETMLASLMRGDLNKCLEYDEWLAAHLGDYCNKAQLLDNDPTDTQLSALMADVLTRWAETLLHEERLWRMAVSYLDAVGTSSARAKMRTILLDVPLLDIPVPQGSDMTEAEAQLAKVEEVLSACIEYGMDDEVRLICQRLAQALMERHKYGVAIAYSVRARDARQVRAIADRMLQDYVTLGPESFIASVDSVPASLLEVPETNEDAMSKIPTPFATTSSIFSADTFAPLAFHFKYRDFHRFFAHTSTWPAAARALVDLVTSEVTPASFLSVLLVDALPLLQASTLYFSAADTFELLRIAERVAAANEAEAPGSGDHHYFYWLEQLLAQQQGGDKHSAAQRSALVQERLSVVRLALAQYLSRVYVEASPLA